MGLLSDLDIVKSVFTDSPTKVIRQIEQKLPQVNRGGKAMQKYLTQIPVDASKLNAALNVKRASSQIDVKIHALGILVALPHILEEDEVVISVSLGAGNTGKRFDLITNQRVAEFKFINWRGGSESIRQNNVFKDFLNLVWEKTPKRKQLFLNGTKQALAFLNGGRDLSSVLSKNVELKGKFEAKYGKQYRIMGEFYRKHQTEVEIIDLKAVIPTLQDVTV